MESSVRRVISGDDMQTAKNDSMQQLQEAQEQPMTIDADIPPQSHGASRLAPALVENDVEMDTVNINFPSIASIPPGPVTGEADESEVPEAATVKKADDGAGEQTHQAFEGPKLSRKQALQDVSAMARSDSKMSTGDLSTGSMGPSRDWGWFEDVHASEHANLKLDSRDSKGKASAQSKSVNRSSNMFVVHQGSLSSETLEPIVSRDPQRDAAAMAVTAPTYVLEESLSSQKLWKESAGQRPPQPVEERAFFERMWAQNFARSQVEYQMPVEVLTATTPVSLNPFADGLFETDVGRNEVSNYNMSALPGTGSDDAAPKPGDAAAAAFLSRLNEGQNTSGSTGSAQASTNQADSTSRKVTATADGDTMAILVKGDNVFGTTVSKSFARTSDSGGQIAEVDTVNISVASYRVVESKKIGKHAQFLVIYREGSIRDTIGVWKRYSDFQELSRKVTQTHEGCAAVIANMSPLAMTEEHEVEHLPNAITSWRLLKKRQRWYRCLDAGYLSLKVFLLERFLHDILFESSTPDLLRSFVGVSVPS